MKTPKQQLLYTEGLRAFLCMLPMLIAAAMGKNAYLVALGQGGFFFSSLYLPKKTLDRFILGMLVLVLGLGIYSLGGNVVENSVTAVLMTALVCITLSFLTSWKVGGAMALTLVMIYTAGLNSGSAQRASDNLLYFAIVLSWSALISMLPLFKPVDPPKLPDLTDSERLEQGVRMGLGASIALGLSYAFSVGKLGWASSAVGSVVRYEGAVSKKRAFVRVAGTLGGALMASLVLLLITDVRYILVIGAVFAVFNGLYKQTILGFMPLFYTATILLLYSINDLSSSKSTILARIVLNFAGVIIGLAVALYPSWLQTDKTKKVAAS